MTKEDEMLTQAKKLLETAIRNATNESDPAYCADAVEAIEALIDVKISLSIEALNDRIEDGLGVGP